MMFRWMFEVPPAMDMPSEPMNWFIQRSLPGARPSGASRLSLPRRDNAIRAILWPMFELPSFIGVEEVVINREIVDGRVEPLLIYAERHDEIESSASWLGDPPTAQLSARASAGLRTG